MSGLALLLKEKGFSLTGSDIKESYNTLRLQQAGIKVAIGHNKNNVEGADLVCYSSAVGESNPELEAARILGIKIFQRAELLALLCRGKKTIAISGSHGKTTTSSLVAHCLLSLGYKPAVFVGGIPLNYENNAWWGNDYFVVEADESDASFLNFSPQYSIITNIDYEHIAHYRTLDNLKNAFWRFSLNTENKVIGCQDNVYVKELGERLDNFISYGFGKDNLFRAQDIFFDGKNMHFNFFVGGSFYGEFSLPLLGRHNVSNALASLTLFFLLGFDLGKVKEAFLEFKGVKRRLQFKDTAAGVKFIDDYAHHPSEIKATLEAVKMLKPQRLVGIFQPHRYSRLRNLYQNFYTCFHDLDLLIVTDIYSAGENNPEKINAQDFAQGIKKHKKEVIYLPQERLKEELHSYIEGGDWVIALGAGNINQLTEDALKSIGETKIKA